MKFTLFLIVLFAYAAAASQVDSNSKILTFRVEPSEEGGADGLKKFGKDFGKRALDGIRHIARTVGKNFINKAVQILSDGLHLHPTKEVQDALNITPSTEAIFDAVYSHIYKQAEELTAEHVIEYGANHKDIISHFGLLYKLHEAERIFFLQYKESNTDVEGTPSHEGILGLGKVALKGFGKVVGASGKVISNDGDIIGSLYFALPNIQPEQEISKLETGILTNAGKLVINGAASTAKALVKSIFKPITDLLHVIFFIGGNFNAYSNIEELGKDAILNAKASIYKYPSAEKCVKDGTHNLTLLYDQYITHSQECIATCHTHGKNIVANMFDIILDGIKRVEDTQREASNCLDKIVDENKILCLEEYVPEQIEEHKKKFVEYRQMLAKFVQEYSKVNTKFDICLTKHLGSLKSNLFYIVYDVESCVDKHTKKSKRRFVKK